jgi:hypothetical protein
VADDSGCRSRVSRGGRGADLLLTSGRSIFLGAAEGNFGGRFGFN